jgi:hypothetical protein
VQLPETRFNQIKPMKRGGPYYRPQDVDLIKGHPPYALRPGYTIKGVQKLLRENNHFLVAIGNGDMAAVEAISQRRRPCGASDARAQPRGMDDEMLVASQR